MTRVEDCHLPVFREPEPPAWVSNVVIAALNIRKMFVRHLCLPRLKPREFIPGDTSGFSQGQVCPMGVSVCPVSSKGYQSGELEYRLHPF